MSRKQFSISEVERTAIRSALECMIPVYERDAEDMRVMAAGNSEGAGYLRLAVQFDDQAKMARALIDRLDD